MKAESESGFVMLWLLPRLCLWILAIWGTQKTDDDPVQRNGQWFRNEKRLSSDGCGKARHAAVYGPGHAAYAARVRDCNDMNREQQTEPFVRAVSIYKIGTTAAPGQDAVPTHGATTHGSTTIKFAPQKKGVGFGPGVERFALSSCVLSWVFVDFFAKLEKCPLQNVIGWLMVLHKRLCVSCILALIGVPVMGVSARWWDPCWRWWGRSSLGIRVLLTKQ